MAFTWPLFGRRPQQPAPAPLQPVEAPVSAIRAPIAIRPTRTDGPALARNLERVRRLRTKIMRKLLAWRAEPFCGWLDQRPTFEREGRPPKRLARWCDVPTAVLIDSFGRLLGASALGASDGTLRGNALLVDAMAKHAAEQPGDATVRKWTIEHLAELVERERLLGSTLGRIDTDAQMIAALRAQHRVRKAHRDVLKDAAARGQALVPVPGNPRRRMPADLTDDQRAYLDAHFARRNELLGVQ